ncbi:MAG: RIP metalloprotease RseP [Treponema sp.]|nr:MAG: RIP metalloprotease RseP [Treponema sp.]
MINILIGILVLSFVVFIHELGHYIAARACGVEVIAFSIGIGPVLLKKKIGMTEYRISLLPLGGYCSMKGEKAFVQAVEENLSEIPKEEGAFYSVSKLRRIIIAFAGPFANYILAIVCFAIVSAIGLTYYTVSNKIAPVYYYSANDNSPSKKADLRMGDRIIQINDEKTEYFDDILKIISVNPNKELTFLVERNGKIITKKITPELNKKTGAGFVGFYAYVPLKVGKVQENSKARKAGFKEGDIITAINDTEIYNDRDLQFYLDNNSDVTKIVFTVLRNEGELKIPIKISENTEGIGDLGLFLESIKVTVEGTNFLKSIQNGFTETNKTFVIVLRGLGLLFKGLDFKSAVSGPISISSMLGETARVGFKESFLKGLSNVANFVSIICISLFIMNLLPIPVLDGGIIFVTLIEIIARKQIPPKILHYVQLAGFFILLVIFVFVLWADIGHLIN